MEVFDKLKQQNELESELLLKENVIRTLQSNNEILQTEVKQSRLDIINAEQIVADLTQKVTDQETEMRKRELEYQTQLREKDEIIQLKTQTIEQLNEDPFSGFRQTPPRDNSRFKAPGSNLQEENIDLRRKLAQKQSEVDYQVQRFNDLLKEVRQRPLHTNIDRERDFQQQEEKLAELESKLREEQMRVSSLEYEKNRISKRAAEVNNQNALLIAQFSNEFIPCYYNDTMSEDEMGNKLKDIQQIIQTNIRLQQQIEDLQSNDDLPALNAGSLKFELDQAKMQRDSYKRDIETANSQIKRLQTSVDFYKMKYEEMEEQFVSLDANEPQREVTIRPSRGRVERETELNRIKAELTATSSRLDELSKEKQQRERAYEDMIKEKNELIVQLHASKEALELKVQTQNAVVEDMQKRLNELDKTNRKLDEQRMKTVAEHSALKSNLESLQSRFNEIESENQEYTSTNRRLTSELEDARVELSELRVKCEALEETASVTQTVSSTLDEFRTAYLQLDASQLQQTKEQLESVRKDNETLANFVKAMNVQQMFAMDKLKTTLADAQLQREAYAQECTTLKQKLNSLQLEHDQLTEKHDTLAQQLIDIDTSDATLESCRKQLQQLRNKISYLEKTVAETNARAEKWNVQLVVSEKQCKTLKEITENLEKSLHESEEKSLRECNRLQEMCDSANNQYQNAQTVIENLRAEINDINSRFSNREAVLEQEINEWKSKLADMEQQKLDLNLQLDNLNGELLAARNHEQELETLVSQKQSEINDLNEIKNALDDECNKKNEEIGNYSDEIQSLNEKLINSDNVLAEVRQGLQAEIDALQQKISIFEKAQFDEHGNRQSVMDNVNQMLSRIASETDQMPLDLTIPEMTNTSEMGKALEIIERMQREKKEEVNRRLQLIAEQQSAAAEPAEEMITMKEFNSVVNKLRAQIDSQSAELQQKMKQIAELRMLEGLQERCTLLDAELAALKAQQKKIAEQTHLQNKFVEDNEKLKAELAETKKNGENIRKLAIQLKAKFNETSTQLTQSRAQYTELEDKYNALVGESSKQSSLIREIAPKPSLETTQSSVVSTSGTQLLTAEERAGRFKADVQARIQQDDSTTPTPKRKRLHEE